MTERAREAINRHAQVAIDTVKQYREFFGEGDLVGEMLTALDAYDKSMREENFQRLKDDHILSRLKRIKAIP